MRSIISLVPPSPEALLSSPFTIALVNQKGGVGKTTLSTNLAAVGHLHGLRTIILDLDAQGSALDWQAARVDGSKLEGLSVCKVDRPLTRPALASLTAGYDLAILDAPPRLGDMTQSAAVAADLVLVPLQASPLDLWAASETLATLARADAIREQLGLKPTNRLVVLNRVQVGTNLGRQAAEAAADIAKIASVTLHQRVAFAACASSGEGVVTMEPESLAAAEIRALFALIVPKRRKAKA